MPTQFELNDQIWHHNAWGRDMFLGIHHAIAFATNASRGLSVTGELLVNVVTCSWFLNTTLSDLAMLNKLDLLLLLAYVLLYSESRVLSCIGLTYLYFLVQCHCAIFGLAAHLGRQIFSCPHSSWSIVGSVCESWLEMLTIPTMQQVARVNLSGQWSTPSIWSMEACCLMRSWGATWYIFDTFSSLLVY